MATRSQNQPWRPEYMTAPPSTCSQLAGNAWGHTCASTGNSLNLDCYPWSASAPVIDERLFWSPAIACPQGWIASTVRTTPYRTYDVDGDAEWIAGETAITCCPSGYGARGDGENCRLDRSVILTDTPCTAGATAVTTEPMSGESASTTIRPYAKELRLRYQQSDLTQSLLLGPTGSVDSRHDNQGLSTGAKAAIGVVVPVVVIGLIVGILLFLRTRKRRRNQETAGTKTCTDPPHFIKAELHSNMSERPRYRDSHDAPEVHRSFEATSNAAELEAGSGVDDAGRGAHMDRSQQSPVQLP